MDKIQASINLHYEVLKQALLAILKSKLLTDEDAQILNYYWHEYKVVSTNKALYAFSSMSLLTGVYSVISDNTILTTTVVCLAPVSMYLLIKLNEIVRKRNMPKKINKLLGLLKLYNKLNHTVVNYYEQRYEVLFTLRLDSSKLFMKMMSEKSKDFLYVYVTKLLKFVRYLMQSMKYLYICSNIKEINNYLICFKWNLSEFNINRSTELNEITENFQRLNELCILLTSNFLSCLGLTFCFDLWKTNTCDIDVIFNDILPDLITLCGDIYEEMNEEFRHIRFTVPKTARREPEIKTITLEKPLLDFLNQIQIVFDIGKCLERTLKKEKLKDIDKIMEFVDIMSLRYSNSETPLLAMQKMLIKYKKNTTKIPFENVVDIVVLKAQEETEGRTVRYDDPTGAVKDEEYEISIHESDEEVEEQFYDANFENLETHKLMIRELDNKLSVIRKVKGIEEANNAKYLEKMRALQDAPIVQISPKPKTISMPPPPPPPLPGPSTVSKADLIAPDEPANIHISRAVQLHAIRFHRKEDVFSFEFDDSSDSDY